MTFRPPATPDRNAPRFAEVATLLRAPLADGLEDVDIGLFGIPYDGALTNRPGARHGPREIRNQSSLIRAINHATRVDPFALTKVRDMGDVAFTAMFDIPASHSEIEAFASALTGADVLPLGFGGDHSVSLPLLRAVAAQGPVALIHVDAHTDTWDSFQGSKFNHGAPFRRAVEEQLIDPARTIQIGIRGTQNTAEGWDYSESHGMRVVFCEELHDVGPVEIAKQACALVGGHPVYLSFDIDSLDPVFAPGTGTPEIGGLTTHQAQVLLRGLRGLNYVGADLVEVSPPFDTGSVTALAGAALGYEILCLLAESRAGV
ncbi:MAG: agmatinase [Pseudomonadota bacterium]